MEVLLDLVAATVMEIKPGEIYEDCAYHPVLCTLVDGDHVEGISLLDGSAPRSCSIKHCGVVVLTIEQVISMRKPCSFCGCPTAFHGGCAGQYPCQQCGACPDLDNKPED